MKPKVGTEAHRHWLISKLKEYLDADGKPTRDAFKESTPGIASRDFAAHGGWRGILHAAQADSGLLPTLPEGHYVRGVSTYLGDDGAPKGQWVKTDTAKESRENLWRRIAAELPDLIQSRAAPVKAPIVTTDDLLDVYPIGDSHFGLLDRDSGYNLADAERLLVEGFGELLARGPGGSKCLIVQLGDFFHSDDSTNRTRRSGNPLDVDGSYLEGRRAGVRAMGAIIRAALDRHSEVIVDNVKGNHDDDSAVWLSLALGLWFENEPRVKIIADDRIRRYHRHGGCLIGTTHGHTARAGDLGGIMAAEVPGDWGETKHRSWLCGHVHHSSKKELRGVTVETFRTLAGRSDYDKANGYMSARELTRITLHRERGEIARAAYRV